MSSEVRLLLLETSGPVGYVGLGTGRQLAGRAKLDRSRQHTRDLMPQCQRLFAEARWKPGDVDGIAVSAGPGSYTGLRVGMMTGKTLAYALSKPLVSIPTFESIAWQCFHDDATLPSLIVVGDGQQDKVYVQQFEKEAQGGRFSSTSSLTIVPGEAWRGGLIAGSTLTGPGLRQQGPLLPPTVALLDEKNWDPGLSSLLAIALEQFENRQFADPFTLEPLYLRASSAEEQWKALGK